MIPSSHSNAEQIRNREFETLLFFILLLFSTATPVDTRAFKECSCCWWVLLICLWFQARAQILNKSETENLKPCCFLSYCCCCSYCRQENLAEASTAPAVRKRMNHGTWASTYASSFLQIAGAVKIVSSVLFQESRLIPVWVLIIMGLIPVLLLVLLLLHGTWASSIFHQKNTNVWIWLEYTFWYWSFV